jgi:hypothetical protein
MGPGEFDGPKQESSNGTADTQNRSSAARQPSGNFTWPAGPEPSKLENQIRRLTFTNQLTRRAAPRASFGLSIQLATCPLSMYFDMSPCNSFKSLYRRSGPRPRFSQSHRQVSIDNDMERVVARHLPEAGPQSRRRFGALQIHQHPMPFFASLFRDCESNRSADALPVSKQIVPLPLGIPVPSWAEAPRFEIAG